MSFIKCVGIEQEYEEQLRHELKSELKKIPNGKLSSTSSRGRIYTTAYSGKKTLYLGNLNTDSNETNRARRIARELTARYCIERMTDNLDTNLELLQFVKDSFKEYDPNKLIDHFPKVYRQITDGIFTHTGFLDYSNWHEDNPPDDFKNDGRINRTASGILVRSKSEMAIADNYTRRKDLFVYESKLVLPDGTVLHPDFKIYIPELRKYRFHEHLGFPDNPEYMRSFLWKEQKYIEFGIYPNRDLLVTIEEPGGGIDMEKLNQMLDWFLA